MGDAFSPIEVCIERIEQEVERLHALVRRMAAQHAKIGRFLDSQERILARRAT